MNTPVKYVYKLMSNCWWELGFSVIPQCPAKLIVVHVGFAFPYSPQPCHLIRVLDDEFSVVALPGNHSLVLLLLQQLQDEVPQLDLPRTGAWLRLVGPIWEGKPCGQTKREKPGGRWDQMRTVVDYTVAYQEAECLLLLLLLSEWWMSDGGEGWCV